MSAAKMNPKRAAALRGLNALRKDENATFNRFMAFYKRNEKALSEEDVCLQDVFYVECLLRENKAKEAVEWAVRRMKMEECSLSLDLLSLLGSMYYDDGQFLLSLHYLNAIDVSVSPNNTKSNDIEINIGDDDEEEMNSKAVTTKTKTTTKWSSTTMKRRRRRQFASEWYRDGTLLECHSVSLDLVIDSLFKRGYLEYRHNGDRHRAVKSWESCFNLISSNVQSRAIYNDHKSMQNDNAMASNLGMYSHLALQCIFNISRIMLQNGRLSSCLSNVRASLQLSPHLESQFHRKMLFKLALLTFHYLSPVDWHKIKTAHSESASNSSSSLNALSRFIPQGIEDEAILALMVHQRLCQLTLQRSVRHKHRRRAQELRSRNLREMEQRSVIWRDVEVDDDGEEKGYSSNADDAKMAENATNTHFEDGIDAQHVSNGHGDGGNDDGDDGDDAVDDGIGSKDKEMVTVNELNLKSKSTVNVNVDYILDDDVALEIEGENVLSLLLVTILLAAKRQFVSLSQCVLRSLNERQIDCSRWYKYALSLYGQRSLTECQRACRHSLQSDTTVDVSSYGPSLSAESLRNHFVLSSTLLASRSAILLDDAKSAMSFGRAAVRLSLESAALSQIATDPDDVANHGPGHLLLVDQRPTAYLMLSIGCSLSAYSHSVSSFEDRKSLHKLAMKSVIRACILSPRKQSIVLQLALCRADLGDVDGALDDVRSLLHNLHPLHSESWHLLSLLLSAKRRWMASYRAIDQALRFCDFRWCTASGHFVDTEHGVGGRGHSFYVHKLLLTKIKILMAQNRVSLPLQLFSDLVKRLKFDDGFYKMAKLPNSHKLCPLFMPSPLSGADSVGGKEEEEEEGGGHSEYAQHCLLRLRLEFIMTLSSFYLRANVGANKFAFHSMEFALQFFGASKGMKGQHHLMADIYSKMGECAQSLGQTTLAMAHYKTATSIHSKHYEALCGQAAIYLMNGQLMESKTVLDAAQKINASDYRAWSIAALIHQKQNRLKQAANAHLTAEELQRHQPVEPYSAVPRCIA